MGRIFCIMGKSGSGKDTVFKELIEDNGLKLLPVVTYTTRPKRDNETDGVEYHFVNEKDIEDFRRAGKIIELRKYNTVKGIWYYCTVDDGRTDLTKGSYLTISTLEAFRGIKKYYGEKAVPIYIEVEDGERLSRALNRERNQHSPDYCEMCRRFLADTEDFSPINLEEAEIKRSFMNNDKLLCEKEISDYIKSFR